ncbi:MAG: hypothetical protein KKD77_24230, partial [Gammaproteobacteria bacterium]|nr:hypothetical protein [Gammaproteobacteria bacterium]
MKTIFRLALLFCLAVAALAQPIQRTPYTTNILGQVIPAGLFTDMNITDDVEFSGGNITYVPLTGDIQTYVNAAVAGDTLVLASGTYAITAPITIAKQLNIRGQGSAGFTTAPATAQHGTLINSATAAVTGFVVNNSNVRIGDLSLNLTGAGSAGITTTNNLFGLVFYNIDVIVNCTGVAQGITINGSDAILRDMTFYVTSSDSVAYGVWAYNDNTCISNNVVDVFGVTGTVLGSLGTAYGFTVANINDDNTITLNLFNTVDRVLDGTAADIGLAVLSTTTTNAFCNAYMSTIQGGGGAGDYDVLINAGNVCNLGGSVVEGNSISGTPTYRATMVA